MNTRYVKTQRGGVDCYMKYVGQEDSTIQSLLIDLGITFVSWLTEAEWQAAVGD